MRLQSIGRLFGVFSEGENEFDGIGPIYGDPDDAPDMWDAQTMQGCFCDLGFTGADCSESKRDLIISLPIFL